MIAYEFKGGTGTSSRRVTVGGETFTVGALVQANYGIRPWLTVLGVPVGREMAENRLRRREAGSIIVVLATDAPLSDALLRQMAKRAGLGIARSGSPAGTARATSSLRCRWPIRCLCLPMRGRSSPGAA